MALLKVYKGTRINQRLDVILIGHIDFGRLIRIKINPEDKLSESNKWVIEDDKNKRKYTLLKPMIRRNHKGLVIAEYSELQIKE